MDMEDCNKKPEEKEHKNNNFDVKPIENTRMENIVEEVNNTSEVTFNSSNPLASSSSSSYSSSMQSEGFSSRLLQPSNGLVGPSSQDMPLVSPLDSILAPRRSSRCGLLEPIPARPPSPHEKPSQFLPTSFNNTNNSLSKSVEDLGQEFSSDAHSLEKDAIFKIMTSSLNEVVNHVKKATKKEMDVEIDEMQSQLRTIKDEVHKKDTIIEHLTELLSTQVSDGSYAMPI